MNEILSQALPDLSTWGAAGSTAILAFVLLKVLSDHREDRKEQMALMERERQLILETLTKMIDSYKGEN